MNKEKQRIAIAEACGWTQIEPCTCCDGVSRGYQPTPGAHKKHLPDYLNDLNAMHEAETVLSRGENYNQTGGFGRYKTALAEVCDEQHPIDATATQRAEAFLRTIGKWEDDK
jgi:hypothetical protein